MFKLYGASLFAGLLVLAANGSSSVAAEIGERNVDGIMDNSFLVEEAYNQEDGVVQHIFTGLYTVERQPGADDSLLALNFSQEWPFLSQTHQLSYSVPYLFSRVDGESEDGFGDVFLNYRYQAYFNEENLMAFAPRASLVLPTGNENRGLGDNSVGAQFNLPFSTAIGEKAFVHLNAGLTYLPEAASVQDRSAVHYNLGSSFIFAPTRNTHLMLEWVGYWVQTGEAGKSKEYEFATLLSPGLRHALNFSNDSQLVLGLAAPIGLTASSPDIGVFFYMSFEHFFKRSAAVRDPALARP